jgi:6-phosphofructokinase
VTARGKADVIELAALTEGRIDERRIQSRHSVAVVDHRAFAAPSHVGDVAVGNFIPLQGGTDQLDSNLVEDAIFGFFDYLGRNVFVAHFRCMDRQLFGNAACHFSLSCMPHNSIAIVE